MGGALCCSSNKGEQQAACVVSCDAVDPEEEEDLQLPSSQLKLATLTLADDAHDSLGDALADLHEAVRLFNQGDCLEAAQKLASAETVIANSPSSKSLSDLKEASLNDPGLKDLKLLLSTTTKGTETSEGSGSLPSSPISPNSDVVRKVQAERLQEMEEALTKVRDLCRLGRVFDAHDALEVLKTDLAASKQLVEGAGDQSVKKVVDNLNSKLKADPMLIKLVSLHPRMQEAVELLRSPADARGVSLAIKDPMLGEAFALDLQIRFAEGAERVKGGPSTQLIVRGDLRNLPTPLINAIVENTETDLFRKEWMQDCTEVSGQPGRPPRLYSTLVHATLSPPTLPMRIEDVLLREFAICPGDDQLPERGPGVVVVEHRPPDGATDYEGLPIPPKRKGIMRLSGGSTAYYKTQSQKPGCTNIVAVSMFGLPIPQVILPLSLLKRLAADLFLNSLKKMKVSLYDEWDQLDYKDRVDGLPDFFGLVKSLPPDKLPVKDSGKA